MSTYKKPLGRSIAFGCVMFTAILCITLSVLNYFNQRNALYGRYQAYITDILHYVDRRIDDEDLKKCIETGVESEKYKQTQLFMDGIMNDFDIHYLYAVKPLNLERSGNMMSVLCAEDDYNRYIDTEGNLYLGYVMDDEYDPETVKLFFKVMEQDGIVFFRDVTEWGMDYTGALPLRGQDGEAYAVLAVDVEITQLQSELWHRAVTNAAVIILLGVVYTLLFLVWTRDNITHPVQLLEKNVVDYAGRSHGQRNVDALHFEEPEIHTENEVESLSHAITRMTEDMQDYVSDILTAEKEKQDMKILAEEMSELANSDGLTGIGNKTAFDREMALLEEERRKNPDAAFGVVMIDLNYLKRTNDTYGHTKGDAALRQLTDVIGEVFGTAPAFRIGGDEFAVILRGEECKNSEAMRERFIREIDRCGHDESLNPWRRISAAIGVACYDSALDENARSVLKRADREMYAMKKAMKAERPE